MIPTAPVLHLLIEILISEIVRFHTVGSLGVFFGRYVVAETAMGESAVIIPRRRTVCHTFQSSEGFFIITVTNIVSRRPQFRRQLLAGLKTAETAVVSESAETAVIPVTTVIPIAAVVTVTAGIAVTETAAETGGIFFHNSFIGLLNFFEFLFGLSFIGIIDISVGMILHAKLAISFFDLIIGSVPGYTQNFIRISHHFVSCSFFRIA